MICMSAQALIPLEAYCAIMIWDRRDYAIVIFEVSCWRHLQHDIAVTTD